MNLKSISIYILIFLMLIACGTNSPVMVEVPNEIVVDSSSNTTPHIIFNDEFNIPRLDISKWTTELTWGRINPPELQYYTPDGFTFEDGALHIIANKTPLNGMEYTSGVITTHQSFQFTYGQVEARLRVPAGQGLWPALWLLDYNGSANEIDILEILGNQPDILYMAMHYPDSNGESQNTMESYAGPDFSADYHIFSVDWSPTAVIWYVDGIERYRMTDHVPTQPMYLIINLAVGGDWPGAPDDTTIFPASFDIDYIRVTQ